MRTTDLEIIEKIKDPFVPSTLQFCMTGRITNSDKTEVVTLADIISAQFTDADYWSALASVRKPNVRATIDNNRVLVKVCPLPGASQGVVPVSLCPCCHQPCYVFFPWGYPGARGGYGSWEKICNHPIWLMTSTLLCATAAPAQRTVRSERNNGS